MSTSSEMTINPTAFTYPNFRFDDNEYNDVVRAPQPLSHRNILFINVDPRERGYSVASNDSAGVNGNSLLIYVGPMTRAQYSSDRFQRTAEAMGIPENERNARADEIKTLIYFQPVSIVLFHHVHRTPRVASTEFIVIHVDDSVSDRIKPMYFFLLAVYSPFAPSTLRRLKVYLTHETRVVHLPNGPWFPPSSITSEAVLHADYCSMVLPVYDGACLSRLVIRDPVTPTMLRCYHNAHRDALVKTLQDNAKWLTHLIITLAFCDSLPTILDACATLKHLASLTLTECDPSDQSFDPDDDFKATFARKLQPLVGLKELIIPGKLRNGYLAQWYPNLRVEYVFDYDTEA